MQGAFRRSGSIARVLRISTLRSLPYRSNSQFLIRDVLASANTPTLYRPFHAYTALRNSANAAAAAAPTPEYGDSEPTESAQPTEITQFADLAKQGLVDPAIVRSILRMNITTMTDVQKETIRETLDGHDVLAQAKTGTGKTLAFLVPVLQNIRKALAAQPNTDHETPGYRRYRATGRVDIRALVISPTRELAEQIAVEARKAAIGTGVIVQTAVGGTQKRLGLNMLRKEGCHLLVGTPGRLNDLLSDSYSGVEMPNLNTLVLDEADRLLDDGFAPEIERIQSYLPSPAQVDRQTLMFSATVPREVMRMVKKTMKPNFKFVKTIREDETPTHLSVPQKMVVLRGLENALPAVLELAKLATARAAEDPAARPFKAIVYFNSTMQTTLSYLAFRNLLVDPANPRSGHPLGRLQIFEMHARLSQASRTANSSYFRKAKSAILFSSDVTARGMDFPDVTHVIQVGMPPNRETYVHRLGRTARANKTGEGWILLHEQEYDAFHSKLRGIPIEEDKNSLPEATLDMTREDAATASENVAQIQSAMQTIDPGMRADAYRAALGPLRSTVSYPRGLGLMVNDLAVHGYCLQQPPEWNKNLAVKMGIAHFKGIRTSEARVPSTRQLFTEKPQSGWNDNFAPPPWERDSDRGDHQPRRRDFGRRGSERGGSRGGQSFDRPRRGGSFDRPRRGDSSDRPRRGMRFDWHDDGNM